MKTYYTFLPNKLAFFLLGLTAMLSISCGSYQNASYQDDGIYSTPSTQKTVVVENNSQSPNPYANQFRAMKDDYVYYSEDGTEKKDSVVTVYNSEYSDNNNAGWGNNATEVSINYYGGYYDYYPYWGWGFSFGWNSWYGGYWGWGYPYYGWGWGYPYYGWGYPYYGYGYPYCGYGYGYGVAYNSGPRGGHGYYNNGGGRDGNYNGGRYNIGATPRNNATPRTNTVNPRTNNINPRTNNINPRNTFQNPRTNTQSSNPRGTTSQPRYNNSSYPRSNQSAPREYSAPRSNNYSSPRSSSGGSFGGSSGGGGRSGGGGGGRGGRG